MVGEVKTAEGEVAKNDGSATKSDIDYTALDGPELHAACGVDGYKWAEAYVQHVRKFEGITIDGG